MELSYSQNAKKSKSLCITQKWGNLTAKYTGYENTQGYCSLGVSVNSSFPIILQVYGNDYLKKTSAENLAQDQLIYQYSIPLNTPFYRNLPIKMSRVRFKFSPDNMTPVVGDTLVCSGILSNNANFQVA